VFSTALSTTLVGTLAVLLTVVSALARRLARRLERETQARREAASALEASEEKFARAFQAAETRYRELVENATDLIFTIDPTGRCLSMNRRGQVITGADQPLASNLAALVVPDQVDMFRAHLRRVLTGEDVAPFELDFLNASGQRITLEMGMRPVYDKGVAVAAQGIARDVTLRKELEVKLHQGQKMDAIGQLAAGVAHDFNNLLTVILGHCDASVAIVQPGDPMRKALQGIRAAAERAAGLTGQLLAFSRRQMIRPRPIDINAVVGDVKAMLSRLIGEDIDVQFHPGANLGAISADPGQLQQVIINLAVNARDAMPGGGRLTITTSLETLSGGASQEHPQMPPGDYVMLSVADTGAGMDQPTRERIFEPFFTTKAVGHGTGLGLATVYGVVKQNNAFIWVYSEPGAGSTFKVYFPRVHDAAQTMPADPVRGCHAAGQETVLLVEDEHDLREILQECLEGAGYAVVSAGTGDECLTVMRGRRGSASLLITDVVMPGMSGRALADELRRSDPDLKVLYLSGYTDDAVVRRGILPHGTHFLQKPFALRTFARKVRDVLDETIPAPA
jgi:PAS domain S-box-containing protein